MNLLLSTSTKTEAFTILTYFHVLQKQNQTWQKIFATFDQP